MSVEQKPNSVQTFGEELRHGWLALPDKSMFLVLLAAWFALFQFWGNSTFGYKNTPSLFGWLDYSYQTPDDAHGQLIPFVVLALFWWKRKILLEIPKAHWWPGLIGVIFALMLHVIGFKIQQTRLSVVAFFVGPYAIMGLVWGRQWLINSFFPYFLFSFCLPVNTLADQLTLPLRFLASAITVWISHVLLGINVIRQGTMLFDANGSYQYEIAAACSGLRSLIAILALAVIFAFMNYRCLGRRLLIIAAAFPLALAGNVIRLLVIILAAELFGQKAGNYVHENAFFSLLPYLPVLAGLPLLGFFLKEPPDVLVPPAAGAPKPA
jgi:exosortase